jgi:hypothetical protein
MVQTVRESLLWRLEELAQNAFDALDAHHFVASSLSVRALMETVAALIFLERTLGTAINSGLDKEQILKINKLLINSKIWEEIEDPIHINNMLREVEKIIPGFFEKNYAALSEMAHPNWAGTFGAFGEFEKSKYLSLFRKGGRSPDNTRKKILGNLAASLRLAKYYYEVIGEDLEAFTNAVEIFFAKSPPPHDEFQES